MERRGRPALTRAMTSITPSHDSKPATPTFAQVERAIQRRSFCILATASPTNRPHAAGVLYAYAEGALYISTERESRKARNIAANPAAFISIPVRRLPVGPPSSVQFAGAAEVIDLDDTGVRDLVAKGALKAITKHGELELDGGCFLRVTPGPAIHTYGIGMPLLRLIRDPLNAAATVRRPQ
jgi:hypothetical protein